METLLQKTNEKRNGVKTVCKHNALRCRMTHSLTAVWGDWIHSTQESLIEQIDMIVFCTGLVKAQHLKLPVRDGKP